MHDNVLFIITMVYNIYDWLYIAYTVHIGMSEGIGALIVGIMSGANAVGRIILGHTSDVM